MNKYLILLCLFMTLLGTSAFTSVPHRLSKITPKGSYLLQNSQVRSSNPNLKCPSPGQYYWAKIDDHRWAYKMTSQTFIGATTSRLNKGYSPEETNPKHEQAPGLHRFFKNSLQAHTLSEEIYTYFIENNTKTQEWLEKKSISKLGPNKVLYSRYKKERVKGKLVTKEELHCPYVRKSLFKSLIVNN